MKRNFSLCVKDPQYKVSAGEAIGVENTEGNSSCNGEQRVGTRTQGTGELFKVDKTVLIFVYQAENPEREGALGGAESPGLQQGE